MKRQLLSEIRRLKEFPDYGVDKEGNVWSFRFRKTKAMRPSTNRGGYLQVILRGKEKPSTQRVHVLVATAFLGERPAGLDTNHKDGNKKNNKAENLEYCTRSYNTKHAIELGLRTYRHELPVGFIKRHTSKL